VGLANGRDYSWGVGKVKPGTVGAAPIQEADHGIKERVNA
jgi:hypothetical protein